VHFDMHCAQATSGVSLHLHGVDNFANNFSLTESISFFHNPAVYCMSL